MGNPKRVHVRHAPHHLLEEAIGLGYFQAVARIVADEVEEIAAIAILHHFAIGGGGLGQREEVEGLYDVAVVEAGCDAELGCQTLDVLFVGLGPFFTEFLHNPIIIESLHFWVHSFLLSYLDSVQALALAARRVCLVCDTHDAKRTSSDNFLAGAPLVCQTGVARPRRLGRCRFAVFIGRGCCTQRESVERLARLTLQKSSDTMQRRHQTVARCVLDIVGVSAIFWIVLEARRGMWRVQRRLHWGGMG